MKKLDLKTSFIAVGMFCALSSAAAAQKPKPAAKTQKPIIFAVVNDGKMIEPIAYINRGRLEAPVNGSDEESIIAAFNKAYYKAGTSYRLIFGGANAGTVTVKSSNAASDCSKNMATVTTKALKTPLAGLVMGLATNGPNKSGGVSFRRKPTAAEKTEIENLVRAEFSKQKLTPRTLRYQNLTALDVDNDGKPEFVGSYWVEIDKLTRGLLFFIATQDSKGKFVMNHRDYRSIDQAGVMSGEIKSVDEGVYHELLLDAFDYDSDGAAEIFTYVQSFEGSGFSAYKLSKGKWARVYEFSNYHCGY